MKLKIRKRDYKMGDATLVQTADDFVDSAQRDATELAAFGITPASITAIETARTAFADKPSDVFYMSDMMIATEAKNALRQQLLSEVRQIGGRAKIKFGEDSAKYRKFDLEKLSAQTDNDLVRVGRSAIEAATEYLAELATTGLTQTMIDDLKATNVAFDDAIDAQKKAIKKRDFAVDERIMLGNELYKLVVELAEYGKLCWEEVNEAKYNDYVIYRSAVAHPPLFETEGTVSAGEVVSASVSGVSVDTHLILANNSVVDLQFYFADSPVGETGAHIVVVPPNSELSVQAIALGFNEVEGSVYLNVRNTSLTDAGYKIKWD